MTNHCLVRDGAHDQTVEIDASRALGGVPHGETVGYHEVSGQMITSEYHHIDYVAYPPWPRPYPPLKMSWYCWDQMSQAQHALGWHCWGHTYALMDGYLYWCEMVTGEIMARKHSYEGARGTPPLPCS